MFVLCNLSFGLCYINCLIRQSNLMISWEKNIPCSADAYRISSATFLWLADVNDALNASSYA